MEIVNRGVKPEDRRWEATCEKCETIVHYNRDEVQWQDGPEPPYPWEPRMPGFSYVPCPVCGNRMSTTRGTRLGTRESAHRRVK